MAEKTQAKEPNFFDDLQSGFDIEEAIRQRNENEEKSNKIDYLIHYVFMQDEKGRELLEIWKDVLIMVPTADDGMDVVAIGIREGMKRFIRGILLTINRVEKGEK